MSRCFGVWRPKGEPRGDQGLSGLYGQHNSTVAVVIGAKESRRGISQGMVRSRGTCGGEWEAANSDVGDVRICHPSHVKCSREDLTIVLELRELVREIVLLLSMVNQRIAFAWICVLSNFGPC